jgi:hypothetical protein
VRALARSPRCPSRAPAALFKRLTACIAEQLFRVGKKLEAEVLFASIKSTEPRSNYTGYTLALALVKAGRAEEAGGVARRMSSDTLTKVIGLTLASSPSLK